MRIATHRDLLLMTPSERALWRSLPRQYEIDVTVAYRVEEVIARRLAERARRQSGGVA